VAAQQSRSGERFVTVGTDVRLDDGMSVMDVSCQMAELREAA